MVKVSHKSNEGQLSGLYVKSISGLLLALLILNGLTFGNTTEDNVLSESRSTSDTLVGVAGNDFAAILELYVDENGLVDYRSLKQDRDSLDRYVDTLGKIDPKAFEAWSDLEKIAFWINAYNGLTLQTIVDHYPIEKGNLISGYRYPANSIRQISGAWDGLKHTVMGREMTLNDIEHETLRKHFDEPRIHVALVCASMGCPPLRNELYRADRLDDQLNDQARRFFGDPEKFRIDRGQNVVFMPSIFKWFGSDFDNQYQTDEFQNANKKMRRVLEYVSRNVSQEDSQYLKTQTYRVEYLNYDWSLNEQK